MYFESYAKIWNEHANTIEKNSVKFLGTIRKSHEKQPTQFTDFLSKVQGMDMTYAQNQRTFAKKVQLLVNTNLSKCTIALKTLMIEK